MFDAQVVQTVQSVAHSIQGEWPANLGGALALVPTLEWAKRSVRPTLAWVNDRTAPLISVVSAAAIAAGIHGSFGRQWDMQSGILRLDLTITGVTLIGVALFVFEVGKQWLGQHWIYKLYQFFDAAKSLARYINTVANIPTPSVTGATGNGESNGAALSNWRPINVSKV